MQTSKTLLLLKLITALALLNLLAIVVAIGGRPVFDWAPFSAFLILFRAIPIGLGFAAAGLVICIVALIKQHGVARNLGIVTLVAGLAPLAGTFAMVGPSGLKAPMIHDISTDLDDPPQFVVAMTLRGAHENTLEYGGEKIAAQQRQAYPDIAPLLSTLDADASFKRALGVAQALNWTVTLQDPEQGVIEAYDRTPLFGFIDDIAIRIRAAAGGSRLDLRSVSRVGLSDVGANAARIRRFFAAFQAG